LANSLDIRNADFVDKIGLHGAFSRCDRSAWKATQKASTTE
jgi:hypothetical protein